MDAFVQMILTFMHAADPSLVVLACMAITVMAVVWSWHSNPKLDFHLQQCLTDNTTGKIAIEKIGFMSVLVIWLWGFVAQVFNNHLSDWYVGIGITAFVMGRAASQAISVAKDIKTGVTNAEPAKPL